MEVQKIQKSFEAKAAKISTDMELQKMQQRLELMSIENDQKLQLQRLEMQQKLQEEQATLALKKARVPEEHAHFAAFGVWSFFSCHGSFFAFGNVHSKGFCCCVFPYRSKLFAYPSFFQCFSFFPPFDAF